MKHAATQTKTIKSGGTFSKVAEEARAAFHKYREKYKGAEEPRTSLQKRMQSSDGRR